MNRKHVPGSALPFQTDFSIRPGDVVVCVDSRGRVTFWNDEAARVLGFPAPEVVGRELSRVCPVPGLDLAAVRRGEQFSAGVALRSKSGVVVQLFVYAAGALAADGSGRGVVLLGRDVSGFWRAEEAVRSAEDRYRLLFEHSSDSVAIADIRGRVLEANPACLRLYGYTAEQVRSMNLADVVAPEDSTVAAEAMADLAAGRLVTKTVRMVRQNGVRFIADLVASVVPVGGEQRIFSVTRDVTARELAAEATRASERKYRAIFDSVGDAVFLETPDGAILEINDNACRLLGYAREELLALKVSDLVPSEMRTWLPRVTEAVIRDRMFRAETVNVRKDGVRIPVEITLSAFDLENRTLIIAVVRDVSERRRAEEALRREKERAELYLAVAGVILVALDRTGRVTLINRKGCAVLGRDEGDIVGRDWTEDFVPVRIRAVAKDVQRRLLAGELERVEYVESAIVTSSGEERLVAWHNAAIRDEAGNITGTLSSGEDVTDQRQAQRALEDSEAGFRALAENASEGIMIAASNPDRLLYANSRMAEIAGWSLDELYGLSMQDLLPPEWVTRISERRRQRSAGQQIPSQYAMELLRKNHSRVAVEVAFAYTRWKGQSASLMLVRDISERRAAEQALRESEEKHRSVVERASDGICVIQDGCIKYLNRRLAEMAGYTPEELMGKQFLNYLRPEDRAMVVDRYQRRLAGETLPSAYTVSFLTRSGQTTPVEVNAATAVYGGVPADIVLVRDITERRRAEQAVRESEERLRGLLDAAPDGIAVHQAGRVVLMNPAGARILGYDDPGQVVGMSVSDFLHPEESAEVLDRMRRVLESGPTGRTAEARFRRRDGSYVPLAVASARLTWDGRPAIQVAFRDTSESHAAARALRESEERFRKLVDASPDGIALYQDSRVVFANRACAVLLGYESPEALVGRRASEFVFPVDLASVMERELMLEGRPSGEVEGPLRVRFRRRDGSWLCSEVVGVMTVWQGRPAVQISARMGSEAVEPVA